MWSPRLLFSRMVRWRTGYLGPGICLAFYLEGGRGDGLTRTITFSELSLFSDPNM